MIKSIKALPSAGDLRLLHTKLELFLKSATDSTARATKAYKAFSDWEILIKKLRQGILRKQRALSDLPAPSPVSPPRPRPLLAVPRIPKLPTPEKSVVRWGRKGKENDPCWAELAGIDACFRRFYGFLTYNAGGITFPEIATTTKGRKYLVDLHKTSARHSKLISTERTEEVMYNCGVVTSLHHMVQVSPSSFEHRINPLIVVPDHGPNQT